jgi:hypothetical protein
MFCTIEPQRWADLVVFNKTKEVESACVIELKLGKPLAPHQDPSKPAFSAESGYGRFIVNDKAVLGNLRRRYVVLGAVPPPDIPVHPSTGLTLANKPWEELEQRLPDTSLTSILVELLQAFGVAAFRYRLTKFMKIQTSLQQAAQAHALLHDTAEKLGFRVNPKSWDIRATDPADPGWPRWRRPRRGWHRKPPAVGSNPFCRISFAKPRAVSVTRSTGRPASASRRSRIISASPWEASRTTSSEVTQSNRKRRSCHQRRVIC